MFRPHEDQNMAHVKTKPRPRSRPRPHRTPKPSPRAPRAGKATLRSINPANAELLEVFAETTPSRLDDILEDSARAYQDWRRRPLADRTALLRRAARVLRDGKTKYARTMA